MENLEVILRIRPKNYSEIELCDPEIWSIYGNSICIYPEKLNELIEMKKILPNQQNFFSLS